MQTATVTPIKPTKSNELITDCRKLARERLPQSLSFVLNQVDDALFDLANTADNSNRQNLFFDAMRELRLKRSEFEASFLESFDTNFEDSMDLNQAKRREQSAFDSPGELSLIAADDVEQALAVTNFADSIRSRFREELFALDRRIGVLLRAPELEDDDNPLGPHAIGDALRHACETLESDIEIKLTLFKLFDKFASQAINQLYHDLNEHLVKADVLPTITAQAPQQKSGTRKTRVIIESEQDSVEAAGEDVFSTLQQLMTGQPGPAGGPMAPGSGGIGLPAGPGGVSIRHTGAAGPATGGVPTGAGQAIGAGVGAGGPGHPGGTGFAPAGAGSTASGGAAMGSAPLVQTLTVLQRADSSAGGETIWNAVDQGQVAAGNVNVLHALRESGAIAEMGPNEGLTLDIVSLLFDYVLDDPAIPDALKALIGRLQIPVLKVAILDKDVFSKKSHPARRLLDELARASIGWSEGLRQQDALYDKVKGVVRRIVTDFDDDVALFEEVLGEFLAFLEDESALAEERVEKSTQSLNTKERIVQAKMEVDDELNARLADYEVREFIENFVLDYWRQLMIITLIESGQNSEAWKVQMQVVDDLLWSVQPKATPVERKALTARLPRLVKGIKSGMQMLEMDPVDCSKFLSMLASVHVVSIKNIEETSIAERKLIEAEERLVAERAEAEAQGVLDPASEEFIKKGLERIFENQNVEDMELDIDFSLFEQGDESEADLDPETADASLMEFIELVTTLDLGDWVEFESDDGTTTRARFTWISPNSGHYLFTTREGKKAIDTTMQDLAVELQKGRASIIKSDPDPLFDRALGDLIDKLEAGEPLT